MIEQHYHPCSKPTGTVATASGPPVPPADDSRPPTTGRNSTIAMGDTIHVVPVNDLVTHVIDGDDCVCGATTEPVPREDGSVGWLVTHHSLDGRESKEGNQ